MLDSFSAVDSEKPKEGTIFNPKDHLSSLCANGRIQISPYAQIKYTSGWFEIVEEMIKSISSHPIEVMSLHQDFGLLIVTFTSYAKHHEVKVWRAISRAQNISKETCSICGNSGKPRIHGDKLVIICRKCINTLEKNGETGTWLDKY